MNTLADTRIRTDMGSRGEQLFYLPRGGLRAAPIGGSLFLVVWLAGWTVGGTFALGALIAGKMPLFGRLFLLLWLGGWAVGEYSALRALGRMWGGMLAPEKLAFSSDGFSISRGWLGIEAASHYPLDQVSEFRVSPTHEGMTTGQAGRTVAFSCGKRQIYFGAGLGEPEAKALADELNRLREGYRRP